MTGEAIVQTARAVQQPEAVQAVASDMPQLYDALDQAGLLGTMKDCVLIEDLNRSSGLAVVSAARVLIRGVLVQGL